MNDSIESLRGEAFRLQAQWITDHFGEEAAANANYGWYTDEGRVETKVYGHGVLVTFFDGQHHWVDRAVLRHSERFRRVSNRYPLRVTEAYGGDLARAAADSDEEVAATVAAWERGQGIEPRDWEAIGAEERDEAGESPAA